MTLLVAVITAFSSGTRARARKEIQELLDIRAKVPVSEQEHIDLIVIWRLQALTKIISWPRYWRLQWAAVAMLISIGLALTATSFYYSHRAASQEKYLTDDATRTRLINTVQTLSDRSDQAAIAELATAQRSILATIENDSSRLTKLEHLSKLAVVYRIAGIVPLAVALGLLYLLARQLIQQAKTRAEIAEASDNDDQP
ncbi:MAG TPA: hypothetical protein VGB75_17845 [Jatrophihabitans sp.]|uniref:hypothetical protein n=1 Tax=Jatrophihabitans sp. TaxID=1932789 RepID=UPI002F11E136